MIGFDGQTYVGAGNEVEDGVRGKRIGTGTMQPCAGVGGGEALPETEVAIFAVEGVDPADEVIAAGWGTLVPYRSDLPDEDTP